jgi:7-carboxy-7-deazaguanine synthase
VVQGARNSHTGRRSVSGFQRGTIGAATAGKDVERKALISESRADRLERLRVNEIFHSLQGEADSVGYPTVFVRLTGCPLRCRYCDTEYAFYEGDWTTVTEVVKKVQSFDTRHVCVTGGEPLAQPGCQGLLHNLCDAGFRVSLETSGAMDIARVDPRVVRVVDIKTPGSGEEARNRLENLTELRAGDQLKFVLCGREDYDWGKAFIQRHGLGGRCEILFSPSFNQLPPAELAGWILHDRLAVRFQLQLHKILWGDVPGK